MLSNVLPFQQDSDLQKIATNVTLAAGGVGEEVSQLGSQSTGCLSKVDSLEDYNQHVNAFRYLRASMLSGLSFHHTVMGNASGVKIDIWKSLYKLKSVNSSTLSGN